MLTLLYTMEEKNEFDDKKEKKVSEKHKHLANYIKGIHAQLRTESEIYGAEEAWKKHIERNQELAVNFLISLHKNR